MRLVKRNSIMDRAIGEFLEGIDIDTKTVKQVSYIDNKITAVVVEVRGVDRLLSSKILRDLTPVDGIGDLIVYNLEV